MRIFNRPEGVVNFTAGSQASIELSRNYHVEKYLLELEVDITNDATNVSYKDNIFFRLINSLELVADGNQNIKQIPGQKLVINNVYNNGKTGYTSDINTTPSATYTAKQVATIDLSIPGMIRPADTILNARTFQTLFLYVNWGTAQNLGTGINITGARLKISSIQYIGYARNQGERIAYFKETAASYNLTANNNAFYINLPVGKYYQGLLLEVLKDGKRDDGVLNNVILKSGTVVITDLSGYTLKNLNDIDFKVNNISDLVGLYYIDFTPRGHMTDMLDTLSPTGFNTLNLELNIGGITNANGLLNLYYDYVEFTDLVEQ
jgi:hypothetical protein